MSRRGIAAFVVAAVMITAAATGCSKEPTRSTSPGATPSPDVATVTAAVPRLHDVEVLSRTYRLSPSGPLAQPQTVRLPLARQVPSDWSVVVATAEANDGPWSYLPATLSTDRRTAIFTTTHHSIFTVIGEDVGSLLGFFKTQFLDGLSSRAAIEAAQPSCANSGAARSGYTVQSSSGSTVFWCFGTDSSGQRIFVNGKGWGEVRPATVFNGGDPTGLVTGITWSSWGGSTAVGTGTSDYVGPNESVATGTQERVTITAFDLGTCDGKLMYRAVEWYFPQHGGAFDPGVYENICTGTYVGE
jgi:hypothetical protein